MTRTLQLAGAGGYPLKKKNFNKKFNTVYFPHDEYV